jgi:hypothetical protein
MVREPEGGQAKKLIDAVDYWFHGDGSPGAEMMADAEAYGLELPEAMLRGVDFEVWPENQEVVQLFLRCQTQWRVGMAGVIGLDYGVALSLARLSGAADPLKLLDDLQIMEVHAIDLINEHSRKEP